jgi:branched-chain amino acid transport system substrate-binding protein
MGSFFPGASVFAAPASAPVKIGWVGSMTGPQSKWAAYEAAQIALDEVNAGGGINGRPVQIIWEDGKGAGTAAAAAAQKLINVDRVNYILGGHCTPESLAIAPIAERAGVVMLASITSNPFLTTAGDNIFRLTAVSTVGPAKVFDYAANHFGLKSFAVFYEESDYPRPQAEKFKELVEKRGLSLVAFDGILPNETDMRSRLTAVRTRKPEALYQATLAPDFAEILLRQIREMHLTLRILGNENTGYAVRSASDKGLFEGLIFAASRCDESAPKSKSFFSKFAERYGGKAAPYGCYTAEAYDAVKLIAETIARCGDSPAAVRECLYKTQRYEGASGKFSFDKNGDVIRDYDLLEIKNGTIQRLAETAQH